MRLAHDGYHWFCPCVSKDDGRAYYDEDVLEELKTETPEEKASRHRKIQEAEQRRDKTLQATQLFAFSDAVEYQNRLKEGLQKQLTGCAVCVREYHRSRSLLVAQLQENYESAEVVAFMQTFDAMNIDRISSGLQNLTEGLLDMPPDRRSIATAGEQGTYALLESLNCLPFLRDETLLREHLDKPFRLVQSRKRLKLPTFAPAMTAFLFSHDESRSSWAYRNFNGIARPLTAQEFEYGVRPFLESAMQKVNVLSLELEFLPIFWKGTRQIISKLPKELLSTHLRSLEPNLYTMAMEHWQLDAPHFTDMVACYTLLLTLSPVDFWDAMGGINGQHVVENIMRSPVLQRLLKTTNETEPLNLEEKLSWVLPFVKSMKPANLVPPTRAVLDQLLNKFQQGSGGYSRHAGRVCWKIGLEALLCALQRVKASLDGGPIVVHLVEVVAKDHIGDMMNELDGIETKNEMQVDAQSQMILDIIELALALDVQALAHGRGILLKTKQLDYEIGLSSLQVWKMSIRAIKPGQPFLPVSVLAGVQGLLQLEKFTPRQMQAAPKQTEAWNHGLSRVMKLVGPELLENLESFSPDQLVALYQEAQATSGLVNLLFSGEEGVHQRALAVFKNLSGEDNRRDSLMHLVRAFFGTTLHAVANAQSMIAKHEVFAPCGIFIKLSTDIISCLSDSNDGVLRSATISEDHDIKALELFWETTWTALETIFRQTEPWSNLGYDKGKMQEFCRETMDFADFVFDQYSIIAHTLQSARSGKHERGGKEIGKALLKFPTAAFTNITKWLRLRDEYLITRAVGLTVKILNRLQEVEVEIDEKAAKYIENVVASADKNVQVKTKLTMNQKAELQRALERHLGETIGVAEVTPSAVVAKKQGTLMGWASSGGSGRSTPAETARPKKAGVIDVDAWSAKSESDRERKRLAEEHDRAYAGLIAGASKGTEAFKRMQSQKKPPSGTMPATQMAAQKHQEDQKNFLQKRKLEKEAAERRKAEAIAKQKLGAGSGVDGLGDMGKDHSLKGQNVMVSSDDDSEKDDGDDDDLNNELFGFSSKGDKKSTRPNFDPNGAIGLKPEVKKGPTRIQRTQRSTKDMRARLAPDLQALHKVILKWDFFHDGDYPPGSNPHIFRPVANSFTDPISYQETFEPLLTLEAWQGMVRAREENSAKAYEIKVLNRSNVDNMIEFSTVVGFAENRELSLHEGDIILLSRARKPAEDADAPHALARICKVKRQKQQLEVVYQLMPQTSLSPSLVMGQMVYGLKLQSNIPLEREYGALQGLQYYDLCQQIVKAAPSRRIRFSEKQIANAQDVWNVNRAQADAINAALENEGFSLIQGPPGSGKTKTIVAIVGGLLSQTLGGSSTSATKISMPQAGGGYGGSGGGASTAASRKLLVCAPSNAAVDELVMRLKEGVKTKSGRQYPLNVVRIGRSDQINQQVVDVTMDELVAKRTGAANNDEATRAKNAELFKDHEKVSSALRDAYQKRDSGEVKGKELTNLEQEIVSTRRKKNELGVRIDNVKDQERNAGREAELGRKRAQQAVLDQAHVICATLSGSGHDMFQSLNIEFETVIIDEAAQCVEMSSLIPLKYGCVKCVLVGDPKQLPPTVFSKEAAKFQYEQSLFVRMQNNFKDEVHLLDTQYRMHPEISVFPSRTFYDGLLKDGDGMAGLRQRPWHASALLAPYRFFDVRGQHQAAPKGHSLVNLAEVEVAMAMLTRLTNDFTNYDYNGRIGIITPYKSQLRMLKDRFSQRFGNGVFDMVEFNTTDAFQGRESEIIIFSCVRASPAGGIGFLQDIRRMNVGLTRAKSSLWVLGNSESLVRGRFWKKLVEDAQARDAYTSGDLMGMLRKPSTAFPAANVKTLSMQDVASHVPQMRDSGSRRPSEGTSGATAPRQSATPAPSKQAAGGTQPVKSATQAQESDKMEGVRYRFEDRAASKRAAAPDGGSDRHAPSLPPTGSKAASGDGELDEDVEMADAAGDSVSAGGSRARTPYGNNNAVSSLNGAAKSRAETPLSAASASEEKTASHANGSGKPGSMNTAPPVPQAMAVKKRPAASPFMPAKKNKPRR